MSYYDKKREKVVAQISLKNILFNLLVFFIMTGVIAFLFSVPKIRDTYNPTELRQQFLAEHTEFVEAFRLMKERNFNFQELNKSHAYAKKFAGFFKLEGLCDDYFEACLFNNLTYRTLDGGIVPSYFGSPNVGQFRTRSGALYLIYKYENDLWIFVDVNGIKKKPNRFGVDIFGFYIDEDGNSLKAMGTAGTPFQSINEYCNPKISNRYNGMSCPIKALIDDDYFVNTIKTLF